MKKGQIFRAEDCGIDNIEPADGKDFSLAELQGAVGGYIEVVPVRGFKGMVYADEEGLLKGKPYNVNASAMAGRDLVGDVLFVTKG